MICIFNDKYDFLSNFYNCKVTYEGLTYKNSEAAFQAAKSLDQSVRKQFTNLPPNLAKRLGRQIELRYDWEDVKDQVMYNICWNKFYYNDMLKVRLLDTKEEQLVEGNCWHDNYWGSCTCDDCAGIEKKNKLGKILMRIREELREGVKHE